MKKDTAQTNENEKEISVISTKDELVNLISIVLNSVEVSITDDTDIKKELIKTKEFLKVLLIAFNKKPILPTKTNSYPLLKMKT